MAYDANAAKKTLFSYLDIVKGKENFIDNTGKRGIIYNINPNGDEKCVIFIYPISPKSDKSKYFFDTRSSGLKARIASWKYALKNNLKYFCLGVNDEVEKYRNYIFSLECDEAVVEKISGTDGRTGTQIVISSSYTPSIPFKRIKGTEETSIAVIHKNSIRDYLEKFDNRPYLNVEKELERLPDIESLPDDVDEISGPSDRNDSADYQGSQSAYRCKVDIKAPRNRIIFGAPGTGKSYALNKEIKNLLKNGGYFERITFHPEYSYANFVGTYKPKPDAKQIETITYGFVPGPFTRILIKALNSATKSQPEPFVLIIEEINRANMAAVFGDIFQLLDRDSDGISQYPIHVSEELKEYLMEKLGWLPTDCEHIRLPNNLFIWATMNSADQGVYPMDTAFKRRWNFEYIGINQNDEVIEEYRVILGTGIYKRVVSWNQLRKAINYKLLEYGVNEDKLMGAFFISKNVLEDKSEFIKTFKNKILMYLIEDVAKRKITDLFSGCSQSKLYSSICDEFETKGVSIFCESIRSQFQTTTDEDEPSKGE